MNSCFADDKTYIANTYNRFPLQIVSGKGSLCYDQDGKRYVDLGTGIAVNTLGFSDPMWVEAVTAQLQSFQHTSNLYYTSPCVELAKLLSARIGCKKVFFANSGAEANECAIKVARKYATEKKGIQTPVILTLVNSFHGRTITTLAATGQEVFHKDFLPLTEGFVYTPANDVAALEEAVKTHSPSAILFEMVQGEGGVIPLETGFVEKMVALAAEKDILLVADEVQTGNGRTGKLYSYMHYGFTPDIVTTAKGLGGGLPIGAALLFDKVADILTPSSHGSTFGGNPVCAAGALHILSRLDEELLSGVTQRASLIQESLTGAPGIDSITGLGLMIGIQTKKPAAEVAKLCLEKGVMVLTAKNKVRLLPALNIPLDLLCEALGVLKEVCAS